MVSVIIPTYNAAAFVASAVQSVLDQTWPNVEVIVVDDGSTDDTARVLEPFRGRITYIATENRGPAHARNVGMRAAGGKYIAFLDADDLYLPHKLALQVAFLEAHPEAGMVWTEVTALRETGITEEYHLRSFHTVYDRNRWSYDDLYPVKGKFVQAGFGQPVPYYMGDAFKYTLMGTFVFSNTALFPRAILTQVGYQKEDSPISQDYEFVVRVCKFNHRAGLHTAFLNVPTYLYRYHEHQISMPNQPRTKKTIATEIEIERSVTQAILDHGHSDAEYYARNRDWLDRQLARQYLCLGQKWLEYGDARKARECFRAGHDFDPAFGSNRQAWLLSFLPDLLSRGVSRILRRAKR
jgi:glycosyltransferase involved in cell wall biosynthesis